jgi:arginine repressor
MRTPAKPPERPHWLDTITPDPKVQVTGWSIGFGALSIDHMAELTELRRAFIRWLITTYEVQSLEEISDAVQRRFGAPVTDHTSRSDLKELGATKLAIPGSHKRYRYRLLSSLHDIGVAEELAERIRIDVLNLSIIERFVYIESNRGTAVALLQLLKLALDDGVLRDVAAITSDNDCYVALHMTSPPSAKTWGTWLQKQVG